MPLGPTRRVLTLLLALALLAGLLTPTAALAAPPSLPIVQPSPSAAPRVLVWRFVAVVWWGHNALGLPTRVQYGNGAESRLTYYGLDTPQWGALFFGRPRQNCVIAQSDPNCPYNGDSNALLNLSNWYDSVGNITSIRDRTNGNQVQWFGYDALDRLTQAYTSATGSGTYSHTNAYNVVGNLTVISGTTQWYSDTAHVHAVTHLGGTRAFWYDANGNAITRTVAGVTQVLAWDGENRLASVTQDGITYAYTYDGDGNRVKVTAGIVVTAYVNTTYEVNPGSGSTATYYFLGSQRVAMRTASGVTWLAADHLGSTSLAANAAGAKVSDERYYPYGATRSGSVPTDYQFTGQRKDTATALYYYNARYYDPATGRFISADAIVPSPGNPQALNRYAYTLNNPLRYTDPTGHAPPVLLAPIALALIAYLANPMTVYAPDVNWVAPAIDDANRSTKAYFDMAPGAGDVSDVYGAVTGRTLFTQEELSAGERTLAGLAAALPLATGGMGRRIAASADVARLGDELTGPLKAITPLTNRGALLGAKGARFSSVDLWQDQKMGMLHAENPDPGQRAGQIHFQDWQGQKWLYDPDARSFVPFKDGPVAPRWLIDLLDDERLRAAIDKGLKYLGEVP